MWTNYVLQNKWGLKLKTVILVHPLGLCLTISASCMQVSEVPYTNYRNLIIPCGKNENNGLELFKTTLAEFDKTLKILFPPRQVLGFSFF